MNKNVEVNTVDKAEATAIAAKENWYDTLTELLNMGFDLDKSSARDLLGSVNELINIRRKQIKNHEAYGIYKASEEDYPCSAFLGDVRAFMTFARYMTEISVVASSLSEDIFLYPCNLYANERGEGLEDILSLLNVTIDMLQSLAAEAWSRLCIYAHAPEVIASEMLRDIDISFFHNDLFSSGSGSCARKEVFIEEVERFFLGSPLPEEEVKYSTDDDMVDAFLRVARHVCKESNEEHLQL